MLLSLPWLFDNIRIFDIYTYIVNVILFFKAIQNLKNDTLFIFYFLFFI